MQWPLKIKRSNRNDYSKTGRGNFREKIFEWTFIKEYPSFCLYINTYGYRTCFLKRDLIKVMKEGNINGK